MNSTLRRHLLRQASTLSVLFAVVGILRGEDPLANPANDDAPALPKDSDAEVRAESPREVQTSLDRRLPEALSPLPSDRGDSIRRLGARGVGSRRHQIPAPRNAAFPTAPGPLLADKENYPDGSNVADRARGLLPRRQEGSIFSTIPDGKLLVHAP